MSRGHVATMRSGLTQGTPGRSSRGLLQAMEIATHKPESVEPEGGPTAGNPYLGIGLYTIPEAARLLGLRTGKLRRWADEYSFRSRGRDGFSGPLFERDQPELVKHKILTFAALIELQMIRLFREEGVSMPTIRAAANRGAELYRTNHPFAAKRFHTDGKRIFAEAEHALGGEPLLQPIYKELPR